MAVQNQNQFELSQRKARAPEPEFYMPAMPPIWLTEAISARIANWRRRRNILRLLKYDDRRLEDLGYRRVDLLIEVGLWPRENAELSGYRPRLYG